MSGTSGDLRRHKPLAMSSVFYGFFRGWVLGILCGLEMLLKLILRQVRRSRTLRQQI